MTDKKFMRIAPHIPVKDIKETIEWYKQNLGFTEEWYYNEPATDGGCRRDEMRILFGKADPFVPPKDFSLIMFVNNVEAIYDEMLQRQIPIISPLKTYDYGIREFTIRDINDYYLRISESV